MAYHDLPLPIRVAQTLGISTSFMLSGSTLALSLYTIPRLLESPSPLLLRQWKNMFNVGKKAGPPLSSVAAASFFYLAYNAHITPGIFREAGDAKKWMYVAAALLNVGIVPYTLAVMVPTNHKLMEKAESVAQSKKDIAEPVEELGGESAHQLADWWGVLNLGRGVLLAAGGVLGVWTALN